VSIERVDSACPTGWDSALFRLPTDRRNDSVDHRQPHFDSGVVVPGETPRPTTLFRRPPTLLGDPVCEV